MNQHLKTAFAVAAKAVTGGVIGAVIGAGVGFCSGLPTGTSVASALSGAISGGLAGATAAAICNGKGKAQTAAGCVAGIIVGAVAHQKNISPADIAGCAVFTVAAVASSARYLSERLENATRGKATPSPVHAQPYTFG